MRCPAEEIPRWSGRHRGGGPHTFLCVQQPDLEQGAAVPEHNTQGVLEGVLAFLVPSIQHIAALNSIHPDVGHKGQQKTLALA